MKGAHWDKTNHRWNALLYVNGKNKYIGQFDTEAKAQEAVAIAKAKPKRKPSMLSNPFEVSND